MTRTLGRIGAFVRGELVATLRQPRLLVVLVLGPFLILLAFGVGYERTVPRLTTVVVGSEGELTDRVDAYIRQEEPAGIDYLGTTRDGDAALAALADGQLDLVVVLPDRPLETMAGGEHPVIEIHHSTLDPITANQIAVVAASAVNQINDDIIEQLLTRVVDALGPLATVVPEVERLDPAVIASPFEAHVVSQTPTDVSLDRFYALGLVALMIQHLGVTFAALSLTRERGTGVAEMLRVAPVSIGQRLAGKSIAFVLLGGLATAALTALVVWVFDVPLPAAWLSYIALVALTLLASLGFGFLVAALAATDSQAIQFSMLLLLAAIFFSGLFMPLDRIGMPAEAVAWILPATYAFTGFKDLMLLWQSPGWLILAGPALLGLVTFLAARMILAQRAEPA